MSEKERDEKLKCAVVAIVGRSSVGKSTFINTICESKVSITSPTPGTTRNAIRGVYTDVRGQLIFTDTPGFFSSEKSFNKKMREIAVSTLEESDVVLYMADPTRSPGEEEENLTYILSALEIPVIVCVNKTDAASPESVSVYREYLQKKLPGRKFLEGSALKDEGMDEVLIELFKVSPRGELLYGEEVRTDQNLMFRVSEIIREKTINTLHDEIPYAVFVEVSDLEYRKEENKVWIRAFITAERESQKGIIIGKDGENIKTIRKASFKELKRVFPSTQLEIDLRVRVMPRWKTNAGILHSVFQDPKE